MKSPVFENYNGISVITSESVAEAFKLNHEKLVADIRRLINEDKSRSLYFEEYISGENGDSQGYQLTYEGFSLLVQQFENPIKRRLSREFKYSQAVLLKTKEIVNLIEYTDDDSWSGKYCWDHAAQFIHSRSDFDLKLAHSELKGEEDDIANDVLFSVINSYCTELFNTSEVASELKMSEVLLKRHLRLWRIIFYDNKSWKLYAAHQDQNYTRLVYQQYVNTRGVREIREKTYWTQSGRDFIMNLFSPISKIMCQES